MKPKVLLIEDELLIAAMARQMLLDLGHPAVDICSTLEQARERILAGGFELAIVDINLGRGLEGLDAGQLLRTQGIPFFYLTSYQDPEIIRKAAATGPGTYLVKPFSEGQLLAALELTLLSAPRPALINLPNGTETLRLRPDEICFARSDNNYIDVYTTRQRLTLRMSLKSFRELLPEGRFVQPHRTCLVNKAHISRVTATEVWVDKEVLPLARGYRQALLEQLGTPPKD